MLQRCQFLTILTSKSLSRAGVVLILPHIQQPILRTGPFLGADFPSQRSHKTMEKHSVSRTSYPPNPHVSHLCCITSAWSHLLDRSSAATFSIVGSLIPKLPLINIYTSTGFKSHQLGKSHINPMAGRFGRKSHQRKKVTSICQNYNGTAAEGRCFQKGKITENIAHNGASV